MRKNLLFAAFLAFGAFNYAKAQSVYFNGLGRVVVTNDRLKGLALDPDTLGSRPDTANTRRGTGGYTLFDLGINAQPGEHLRASAILRIRNEFGGFYGNGSRLEFRQLRLEGILNKVVKYQLGSIDLSMTPYTLYNFGEMYHDYEADIFAIRRSIVNYENFNFGNNWRLEGAHANSAIKFNKYVQQIGIGGFAARTRRTNFVTLHDRVLLGGEIDLVQSKYLSLGLNYVTFQDIPNTGTSAISNLNNDVITGEYRLSYDIGEKIGLALYGEIGKSKFEYDTATTNGTVVINKGISGSGFYDLGASVKYNPLNLKVYGQYRYVAPYFSSPSAQTRRIYERQIPGLGIADDPSRTAIYTTIGNNVQNLRQQLLFDRFTDENIRNLSITPFLMGYLPQYNNITPYGTATPNRQGMTLGISAGGSEKVYTADLIVDLLDEVTGEGTEAKRSFTGLKGGASLAVNKLIKFEKAIVVNGGFRYEKTERDENPISLTSTLLDAGLSVEVVKQFDVLGGYKRLNAEGNEFLSVRNGLNQIVGYEIFTINSTQDVLAAGVRYRFSKNTYFTAQGHWVDFTDNDFMFRNYKINQVFLSYTMVF